MKMRLLILTVLLVATNVLAQSSKIRIDVFKDQDTLIFLGSNNSDYIQNVTLKLTELKNLDGYKNPKIIQLQPNTSDIFYKLRITGEYTYDFEYGHLFPSDLISQKDFKVGKDQALLNKGVVVFEKDDCTRCEYVDLYLDKYDIAHQTLNITEDPFYNTLMWQLLQLSGFEGETVNTPVILVDGKISYSHEDLSDFLEKLK